MITTTACERDPRHVMRCYRNYLVTRKRRWGTARGLIYYLPILQEYLRCKRLIGNIGLVPAHAS